MADDTTGTASSEPSARQSADDGLSLAAFEEKFSPSTTRSTPDAATSRTAEREPRESAAAARADTDREPAETSRRSSADRNDRGQFVPKSTPRAETRTETPPPAGDPHVTRLEALERRIQEYEARDRGRQIPEPGREEPRPAAQPAKQKFLTYEQFVSQPGNDKADWDDYYDARTQWNYRQAREFERATEAYEQAKTAYEGHVTTYREKLAAVQQKYPDFDAVVAPGGRSIPVSKVLERAVIEVGPEAAYYLATHPEERDALTRETLVDPANPAFAATVAGMRRYLASLIPAERTAPVRAAATQSLARPPSPVRTAPSRETTRAEAPGDDASLSEFEKFYPRLARRRRA